MYQKIMVPLDGSQLAECVLPHVESIAKGCNLAQVILVRVVEPIHLPVGGWRYTFPKEEEDRTRKELADLIKNEAEKYLKSLKEQSRFGGLDVQTVVLVGKVVEELMGYAEKQGVDLFVMATHGESGVSRWVWGSVADRILRSSCVPVLMVRAPGCVPGI